MIRVVEELLWTLRREGFVIAPSQAIDVARAVSIVGWDDRDAVADAIAAVVVHHARDRSRFELLFARFFAADGPHARDLRGRLRARGLSDEDVDGVVSIVAALADAGTDGAALLLTLLDGAALTHRLLADDVKRALAGATSSLMAGFHAQRAMGLVGFPRATRALGPLRAALVAAFGEEAGARLFEALSAELDAARGQLRAHVDGLVARAAADAPRTDGRAAERPFTALDPRGVEDVRRAIRVLAERLRGAARVRERRGRRGRIDVHRTLRAAMRTGGVPVVPVRRSRRREKARLIVLCDVSDSVRAASVFLLEMLAVMQEVFARTRSFVFVSEIAETTRLFDELPIERALAAVLSGGAVNLAHNSSYGRALRSFEETVGRAIDRRTTIVILGDGRTNYQPPEVEVLTRLRGRARAVLWLCPEPRSAWGAGDSVMPRYAREVTTVLQAGSAAELETAARAILLRR